jgi:ribonuclease-3 family protein
MSTILNLNISYDKECLKNMTPSTFSFVGDAVYGLCVRSYLAKLPRPSKKLHGESVSYVSASAQSKAFGVIEPILSEEEMGIFKRGRNFHTNHTPKNSSSGEYHTATGLETLFGYLYLNGKSERLDELFGIIWEALTTQEN